MVLNVWRMFGEFWTCFHGARSLWYSYGPLNEAAMAAAMARWMAFATMFTDALAIVLKNADLEECRSAHKPGVN